MGIESERLARTIGNDRKLLLKRFRETVSVLLPECKKMFPQKGSHFNFREKRLYSADRAYYLQWKLREYPDIPESYDNQQTNGGRVTFKKTPT